MFMRKPIFQINQYYKKMKWLIFLIVFLLSCQKEYCWECELTQGSRNLPYHDWIFTTSYLEYCDKTEKEINQIMADHEKTHGISHSLHMTCAKR